jgi:predicted nucleotidyltransferase
VERLVERVVECLEQKHVGFAVIGAAALAAHGVSRSTEDLDLLTTSPHALAEDTWRAIERAGSVVDRRVGDAEDPLLGVVRIQSEAQTVDVVVGRHAWQQATIERAAPLLIAGVRVPVVRASDLVLLKLFAAGYQDRQLLTTDAAPTVVHEVEQHLGELPDSCTQLWRTLRAAVGE